MNFNCVYLKPRRVLYVRERGPYPAAVAASWHRLFHWLDQHDLRKHLACGYGLARDDPRMVGRDNCRYDACIDVPAEFDVQLFGTLGMQTLPGGAYTRARVRGSYDNISTTLSELRDRWVPSQGLVLDGARPVVCIYFDDPANHPASQLRADLCLPIMTTAAAGARTARKCETAAA